MDLHPRWKPPLTSTGLRAVPPRCRPDANDRAGLAGMEEQIGQSHGNLNAPVSWGALSIGTATGKGAPPTDLALVIQHEPHP